MARIVPFEGPTNAKIYLVGEAPGATEELEGRPFVGGAGRILNSMLMECGLLRRECRIGNVMRTRPKGNNFKHFYSANHPTQELLDGIKYLIDDIQSVNPNVVLAMGNEPLRALTGQFGIGNWRGSILFPKRVGHKVIPTIHPAALMRQWEHLPLVMFDLRRLKEESVTSDYHLPHYDLTLKPNFTTTMMWLDKLSKVEKFSFDIETDKMMHCTAISFADTPFSAISIPFTTSTGAPYWILEHEIEIWKRLKEVLEDEKTKKIAQNAQFDILVLYARNPLQIQTRNLYLDTMCAHHTIYPELPKGLGTITSIYTRQPYYKHWVHTSDDMQFWKYNAMDSCVTYESSVRIEKEMGEFNVRKFYDKYVHPLIPILMDMQWRGVKIDQDVRETAYQETAGKIAELTVKLNEQVGPVNVMSPAQLKDLLYNKMGLPPKYKRGTYDVTTNEEALKALAKKCPSPIFDLILGIRHERKLLGTYLTDKGGTDGRMRCSYVIGGTKTGRLSSRESVFGTGTNLQNIPKGVCRRMFVSDEGKTFIESDLSQAEARVVAHLANETRLIDLFDKGGDIHSQNAAWIFGHDIEEVTKEQREMAKKLVHASNYGIGPRAFAYHAGVTEMQAKVLLTKYYDVFPNIRAWHLRIQSSLGKNRTMTTPLGRKRTFFGRWGDNLFREAYAYVPQSTVADALNYAMIRIAYEYPWVELMLQVHDSFMIQCKDGDVGVWKERIVGCFDNPITINGRELVIPVEMKVGKNWDDMKEV